MFTRRTYHARPVLITPHGRTLAGQEGNIDMTATTSPVTLSESAARRIVEIVADEPDNKLLRISVEGGGCSGFQYKFDLVPATAADDLIIERSGAKVLIDPVSLGFLAGSEIDFVDDIIGAAFKIRNPNATASCGCGTSFSV
jgi:iron-sulfur cluster assembly accessory protein